MPVSGAGHNWQLYVFCQHQPRRKLAVETPSLFHCQKTIKPERYSSVCLFCNLVGASREDGAGEIQVIQAGIQGVAADGAWRSPVLPEGRTSP